MPPEDKRTGHNKRTVLILSGNKWNSEPNIPSVLVCPVSSGSQATKYDVRLGAGLGGLPKKSWVRTSLTQVIDIRWLEDSPLTTDGIPPDKMQEVLENHQIILTEN